METFEKPRYHWNSVVIEFLVSAGCHFNVNFLFDFGIQKSGVVTKPPALKVELCRYRQHHTDCLKPADQSKRASAFDALYLSPSEHDDSPLVGLFSLDLVHRTRADDLVAGWNGGYRYEGVYVVLFKLTTSLFEAAFQCALAGRVMASLKGFGNNFHFLPHRIPLNIGRGTGILHNRLCFVCLVHDIREQCLGI